MEHQHYNGFDTSTLGNFKSYRKRGFFSWRFLKSFFHGFLYFTTYFGVCINLLGKVFHSSMFLGLLNNVGMLYGLGIFTMFALPILAFLTVVFYAAKYGMKQYDTLGKAYTDENWLAAALMSYTDAHQLYVTLGCQRPPFMGRVTKHIESSSNIYDNLLSIGIGTVINLASSISWLAYLSTIMNVNVWSTAAVLGPFSPFILSLLFVVIYTVIAVLTKEILDPQYAKHVAATEAAQAEFKAVIQVYNNFAHGQRIPVERAKELVCPDCQAEPNFQAELAAATAEGSHLEGTMRLSHVLQCQQLRFLGTYDDNEDYLGPLIAKWHSINNPINSEAGIQVPNRDLEPMQTVLRDDSERYAATVDPVYSAHTLLQYATVPLPLSESRGGVTDPVRFSRVVPPPAEDALPILSISRSAPVSPRG